MTDAERAWLESGFGQFQNHPIHVPLMFAAAYAAGIAAERDRLRIESERLRGEFYAANAARQLLHEQTDRLRTAGEALKMALRDAAPHPEHPTQWIAQAEAALAAWRDALGESDA